MISKYHYWHFIFRQNSKHQTAPAFVVTTNRNNSWFSKISKIRITYIFSPLFKSFKHNLWKGRKIENRIAPSENISSPVYYSKILVVFGLMPKTKKSSSRYKRNYGSVITKGSMSWTSIVKYIALQITYDYYYLGYMAIKNLPI